MARKYQGVNINNSVFEYPADYSNVEALDCGAFGIVCKAKHVQTQMPVAIKRISECFQNQQHAERAYREITFLKTFRHPNLLSLWDVYVSPSKILYVVTQLFPYSLRKVLEANGRLQEDQVRFFTYSLIRGLKYAHSLGVIHRDLKPENILVSEKCDIKICDLGASRVHGKNEDMTGYVTTRYYRAPEIILSWQHYGLAVDMWSAGCIFSEMLTGKILFYGNDHVHQLFLIFYLIGTPDQATIDAVALPHVREYISQLQYFPKQNFSKCFAGVDPQAIDLLEKLLKFNPAERITAAEAIKHPYFAEYRDPDDEPEENEEMEMIGGPQYNLRDWIALIQNEVQNFVPCVGVQDESDS